MMSKPEKMLKMLMWVKSMFWRYIKLSKCWKFGLNIVELNQECSMDGFGDTCSILLGYPCGAMLSLIARHEE